MAKETFSFEEAVAPAKVFSFEEALGEPAATNAPATEPEVVTSARPWQGAGAGRGGLNDPRRLDVARPNVTGSVLDGVNLGRPTVDYEANLDAMQKSASPGSVMFSPGRTKQAVDKQIELGELARRAGYESIPDYVRAQEDSERRQQFAEDNPNIGALASGLATVTKGTLNAIPAAAGFVNKTFVDPFLGIAGARMSDVPTAPGTSALDSMAKDFMPAVGKLKLADAWDGGVFKEWLAANVSAQVPQIAQSVYGVVNPAAVGAILPMMGAQAAGGSFAEGDDPRVAVSKGIVEMLSEGASFGVAEKVKTVLQGLPSAARQSVLRNVAQKALAVGGALTAQQLAGAVEESVAQLGGNALDIYASGKQKSMLDGVPEAAVIGAAVNTAMALPNVAEAARSNRPEDQAARELARELERGNLPPGTVETLNPNLSQPAITPKTLAGLTEIGAAASVDEAIIAAARATTPQAQAVDNIGRLLGDSANVSQPGNIPPVDSGAAGAGAPEPGIRVEAGVGASGAAGPALDAGGVRDQPAGGAAPLAAGRDAELTPDIAETTRQIQELERAPESKPGQETRGEPASVWFGRRGDGYQTPEDAQSALPTRTRISPELDWRVEQMPTGRYRLAGYDTETRAPTFTVRMNPTGTATVLGNPKAIAAKLAEAGITKVLPNRDGVTVATSQAQAAAQFLGGGEAAARTDAASAAIKPVAPPANPPTQAQAGLPAEGAGESRPAPAAAPEQVGPYGRDLTPIAQGGKPFKTKAQADAFRKANTNNMRTVKQGAGFVLRDLTAKELAAREKAAKRIAQPRAGQAGVPISAHEFVVGKGGLARGAMADAGFDRNMKVGNRWLFAGAGKPGLTLAEAAELLAEAGYIREESEAAAAEIIKRSIRTPQYTAEGWERIAEAEQATRFEDHLAAQQEAATDEDPFGPAPAFTPAEVMVVPKSAREEYAALIDAIEAAGLDVDAILEEAARITENLTQEQYSEYVRQALTDAIANSRREADRGESAVQGREDAERSGTESRSSNTGRPGDAPSEADEGLTARSGTQQAAAPQRSKTDGRKLEAGPAELAEAQSFRYKLPSLERLLTKENLDTNDGFHMHLLANAMETARAYNAIMVDSGGDPSGIEYRKPADPKYPNLPEKFAVVLPDASNAGKWRVSYFDPKGFSYHETADSAQDATVEMVSSGFTIKDVGALDRLAATREWALGTDYAALIDQYNRKMITSDEFTARQKALNDDYERDTNPLTAPTQQDVLATQAERERIDREERIGKPALRERIADGKAPLLTFNTSAGTYAASASNAIREGDAKAYEVQLSPTEKERKAIRRAESDMDLADTPEERATAREQLQAAARPAIDRALAEQQSLTAPTEADVLAQQDRREQAEDLDQRKQIQREAEGFQLQAQAPEQRSDNTGDMFGGPTAEDVARARDGRREADAVAQAARDAESGQGGLFASEPTTDYTGAYETDLFGEPLPAKRGNDRPARPVGAGVRGNAQPNQALRDTPRPEGDFYVNTIVGSEVTRKLGARLITSASDAATATKYLYKSAVERLDGIVTDQRGKPLAVIGGFKGANTQASVYPATLLGEAVRIPGAAYVWFSHNHPSGTPTLSSADLALNDNLTDAFRGSGIEPQGLLAVSGGGYGYVDAQGNVGIGGDILDPSESVEVPVVERQLGEGRPAESITAPAVAIDVAKSYYAKAKGSGIILLDSQLRVAGWVPISEPMTGELRGTGALNALYRALSQSNAVASIVVHGGELDGRLPGYSQTTVLKNIAHAMMRMDVKTLDVINVKSSNPSLARAGVWDGSNNGPMFSRAQPFYSALSKSIEGMTPKALPGAIWKDGIKGLINKGAVKEDEVEWSGIREWLDLQTGKVSKDAVLAYLDGNGVQVQEVVLGGTEPKTITSDEALERLRNNMAVGWRRGDQVVQMYSPESIVDDGSYYRELVDNGDAEWIDTGTNVGGEVTNTKYGNYTLPGGENYREVLLTLPTPADDRMPAAKRIGDAMARLREEAAPGVDYMRTPEYQALQKQMRALNDAPDPRANAYQSSHWGGTLNVIAHIRLNDRTDADGNRVLFVEEVQSDWGQEGKKKGFDGSKSDISVQKSSDPEADEDTFDVLIGGRNVGFVHADNEVQALEKAQRQMGNSPMRSGVPSAPFVTSTDKWLTLALKRVITMAAQEGYDKVAFVTGDQSADRYDLSKQVKSIDYQRNPSDGTFKVAVMGLDGQGMIWSKPRATLQEIEDTVGKEIAQKIERNEGQDLGVREVNYDRRLSGDGLKVGGRGMIQFYDKIVPTAANKLLAKLGGGRVETVRVNQTDGFAGNERKAPAKGISSDQLGFTITPAMREKASAGLPLFRKGTDQTPGLTPTQFTQALSEAFGAKVADRLQAKGVVVPLADQTKLPAHVVPYLRAGDVVFGFYDPRTDRTYAVLENLTPDMVKGLALHEVGVHYGFEAMLGADKYKQVMKQLRLMRASGNRSVKKASQTALKSFEVSGLPGVRVGEGVYRYAHPSGDALAAQSAINKLLDKIGVVPGSSVQRGVRSDGLEQTGDRGLRAADQLADLLVSQPAIAERLSALDVKTQNMVLSLVRRSINDSKILKSIVEFVPIDVMDVLKRGQLSAEAFLDDGTMLSDLLSIDKDSAVALRINVAGRIAETITRFARFRAKNDAVVSRQSGRASENGNAALEALTRNQFIAPGLKMVVTDDTLFQEELAYLVQNSPENSVIKDVIARIKAWLFREFGIGGKYLTERDLHMLARAAVQHAARTEPGGVEVPAFMRQNEGMANPGKNGASAEELDDALDALVRNDLEDDQVFTKPLPKADDDSLTYVTKLGGYKGVHVSVRGGALTDTGPREVFFHNDDDEPIGFARLTKNDKRATISMIAFNEDARGNGYAKAFYKYLLDEVGVAVRSDSEITEGTAALYRSLLRDYSGNVDADGRVTILPNTGAPEFSRTPQTETKAFKDWFGDSKVVDAEGRPLVVYHGTNGDFSEFNTAGTMGRWGNTALGAFFAKDSDVAEEYGKTVMPVFLSLKNPYQMPMSEWANMQNTASFEEAKALRDRLVAEGYDGIVGHEAYIAFRPEQIKSATGNRGTFNPADPDIRFSRTNTAQTADADPVRPELSPWRDATGRLQFAPGAWLAAKYGDTGKGAIAGAVTGAMTAGPVGAVVGAAVGAGIGAKLSQLQLKAPTPELRRIMRQMKLDVAKAQEVAAAVAGEATKLTEDERAMVSDLIEKELKAGTIPPEHAVRLAAMINSSMEQQTEELVRLGMLTKDSADRWRGQYLPRYYESKLTEKAGDLWADAMRSITRRPSAMKGIKGKHLRGRGLYETIPESQLEDYKTMGWEVRDPDYQPGVTTDGTVQVWRDFTRQERDKMGEIRDAGFRFVMGYMQTQKDIALGKMFEQLAIDPEMSSRLETEKFSVRVPDGKAPGTEVKTYGKLAGRYVTPETLSQLSLIEESQSEALMMYRKALGIWKEGKTVLNPVSHVNNTISNMSMAHFAGVSYGRADKYLAAMRDFAKKSPMILEAKDNGLFLGTLSEAELMNTLPEDLKALAQKQEGTAEKVGRTTFNLMTFYLRRPMGWAYQAEDTFFRYLIYKDARGRGMEPQDAVDYAQRYIFTYDDLPKTARRIRDFGIPFFAYTYKAVPALLHTALTHPERLAAPAAVLWTINAAAYAIAAGDDEDDWDVKLRRYLTDPEYREKARAKEKLERELLPEWNKGTTSLMTPKVIRLGNDELTKLPMFIDVSRIIPGGDLFDVNPNAGGIGLPQPITPSHPLFTTAVAMLANKDLFFGKDLTDSNDTAGEKFDKRAAWMWKQLTPAIAVNNYHFERGMNALAQASGGEVTWLPEFVSKNYTGVGRDGLPVQPKLAALQTFGIKIRPYDLDKAEQIQEGMRNKLIREIDAEMRSLRRLNNLGAVSDQSYEKAKELSSTKKDRVREGKSVDGEDLR